MLKNIKIGLIYCALALLSTATAQAELVVYALDENKSSLTLSGNLLSFQLEEQSLGSLSTSYTGIIRTEQTVDKIQFIGAEIAAQDSGIYVPGIAGNGSAPANYGADLDLSVLGTGKVALHDLNFDLFSEVIDFDTSFDIGQINFSLLSGSLDFNFGLFGVGSDNLRGRSAQNGSLQGLITANDGLEMINIPVDFTIMLDIDSDLNFSGKLVAKKVLLGDFNLDDCVNSSDFNVIATNWGSDGKYWSTGDITGDGQTNSADLNALALNWQAGSGCNS